MLRFAPIAALAVLLTSLPAHAAVDRLLNIQGMVLTSGGTPATGPYDMTFRLFAAETGGSALWSQTKAQVEVTAGLFDAVIGPVDIALDPYPTLWLETVVETETLPRRPLGAVPYALVAEVANTAKTAAAITCSGCVTAAAVGFPFAAGTSKGGAAADLDCGSACVSSGEIDAAAIGTSHLQAGSVGSAQLGVNYASSDSKGGPALALSCSGCVTSAHMAPSISIAAAFTACTGDQAGCAIKVSDLALVDRNTGWLNVEVPSGLRVRDATNQAWRPIEAAGITVTGDATVGGKLGVGTSTPQAALSVAGGIQAGDDTGACTGPRQGTVRWSSSGLQVCDGSAWTAVGGGSGGGGDSVQLGPDSSPCTPSKAGTLRWSGATAEICNGVAWDILYDGSPRDGKAKNRAAVSCMAILDDGFSTGSGTYWIDPTGGATDDAFPAFCEMVIEGGGWTRVLWANADVGICAVDDELPGSNENLIAGSGPSAALPWETVNLLFPDGFAGFGELLGVTNGYDHYTVLRSASANWQCFAVGGCFNYNQPVNTVEYKVKGGAWLPAESCCCGPSSYCGSPTSMIMGIGGYQVSLPRKNSTCPTTYLGLHYSSGWSTKGALYVRAASKKVNTPKNGATKGQAARSCKAIKAGGFSNGDGQYWIDPNEGDSVDAFKAWCDMTTDGGGWTRVLWTNAGQAICAISDGLPGGVANVAYGAGPSAGINWEVANLLFDQGFPGQGELMGVLTNGTRVNLKSATANWECFAIGTCFQYNQVANNVQFKVNGGSWQAAANCCCGPSSYCGSPSSIIMGIGAYLNGVPRSNSSCSQTYLGFHSGGWTVAGYAYVR